MRATTFSTPKVSRASRAEMMFELSPLLTAAAIGIAERPWPLPEHGIHACGTGIQHTHRGAGGITDIDALLACRQADRLREGGFDPDAIVHAELAAAGEHPALATLQVIAPDAVVAGAGDEQLLTAGDDRLGRQRVRAAGMAVERGDLPAAHVDPAYAVVAAIGHEQAAMVQGQASGIAE